MKNLFALLVSLLAFPTLASQICSDATGTLVYVTYEGNYGIPPRPGVPRMVETERWTLNGKLLGSHTVYSEGPAKDEGPGVKATWNAAARVVLKKEELEPRPFAWRETTAIEVQVVAAVEPPYVVTKTMLCEQTEHPPAP